MSEARIPVPGGTILDTTIEAHVYLLRHEQATLRLEQLKAEIEQALLPSQITRPQMPVVLPSRIVTTEAIKRIR